MSEIDTYRHECIGVVDCPSAYEIVHGNNRHRLIALYRLEEDALEDCDSWCAKTGDLLLGGGSGESAALRISIPEAFYSYTHEAWDAIDSLDEICHAYWTNTEAFVFCEGYAKLGWTPQHPIEVWLTEHILAFVAREYPERYDQFVGNSPLNQDGSICRKPTAKEKQGLLDIP
jgi:hypothetical protein